MKKIYKINLFKDKKDYEKILTADNVVNVIGAKGSGKTTLSLKYLSDDNYIVINCDKLFELPSIENEDKELTKIRDMLKEKYGTIKDGKEFIKCYNDIIEYILDKKKKCIIEGNVIQDILPELLKGKIIVKRTAIFKSYIRAVKRDYKNEYFMNLEKEENKYLYKLTRLCKISKRRSNIFKQVKEVENIIINLEAIKMDN